MKSVMILGFSLAGVAIVIFNSIPQIYRILDQYTEIQTIKIANNQLASQINTLRELQNQNLKQRVQTLITNLPLEFDVSFIISTVKQLSEENSVNLIGVSSQIQEEKTGRDTPVPGVTVQQLELKLSGETENLIKFLEQIYQISPLLQVEEVNYTRRENSSPEAKVVVKSYVLPESALSSEQAGMDVPRFTAEQEKLYQQLTLRRQYPFIPVTLPENINREDLFNLTP
jgi:Tfp pilus assembly protein PilO